MSKIVLVGLGGFLGSVLRYLLGGWIQSLSQSAVFPFNTLAINTLGCLTIGMLSQLADSHGVFTPEARLLVFVGVLGGFTTFSTFANETVNLSRAGETIPAVLNAALHLLLGLGAVWLGRALAYWLWR